MNRYLPSLVAILLVASNILHPLYHWMEGGTIDQWLDYLNAYSAQIIHQLR